MDDYSNFSSLQLDNNKEMDIDTSDSEMDIKTGNDLISDSNAAAIVTAQPSHFSSASKEARLCVAYCK